MEKNKDDFKLIGPRGKEHQPASAVTLSCRLSQPISAVVYKIRWFKGTDCICLFKDGRETKGRGYEGRVSLFTDELERGNVSLQITDCVQTDTGHYLCQVTGGDNVKEITLRVWEGLASLSSKLLSVQQEDKKWTKEERMKMEESALLLEFSEEAKLYKSKESILMQKNAQLMDKEKQIQEKDKLLKETKDKLDQTTKETQIQLQEKDTQLEKTSKLLNEKEMLLEKMEKEVETLRKELEEMKTELHYQQKELEEKKQQLQLKEEKISDLQNETKTLKTVISSQKTDVADKIQQLEEAKNIITERETRLLEKEQQVQQKDRLLSEVKDELKQTTNTLEENHRKELDTMEKKLVEKDQECENMEKELQRRFKRRDSIDLPPIMSEDIQSKDQEEGSASPGSVPVPNVRLVLVGRSGSEKSSAGNIILCREQIQAGASPVRQQSESRQEEVAGRPVTVVDTPDWFCPGLSLEEVRQDVRLCLRLSDPGPHAFLLLVPVKPSAGQERGMLEKMEELFGERCWRNTIILFTVTDEDPEKNIEEFVQSGEQELRSLVEKCENRFHRLNIQSGDHSQISELLVKIDKMVEGNEEKFYSSEIYLETESHVREIQEVVRKIQEEEIRKRLQRSVDGILVKCQESTTTFHKQITQHKEQIAELERELEEVKDETRKEELKKELERENQQMNEAQLEIERLREETEKEKREMEERHKQEVEEIRKTYEGERNLMKILLPKLQKRMCAQLAKKQKEFECRMDEKERELEALKQKVRDNIKDLLIQL